MKNRLLSILLCAMMILSLVPAGIFAEAAGSGEHTHCVCGASSCSVRGHGGDLEWKPISSLSSITSKGNYYLTKDVEISSGALRINKSTGPVKLCLNGKTITWTGTASRDNWYAVIYLGKGADFTITDCHSDDEMGKIIRTKNDSGNLDYNLICNEDGTLNIWNGRIGGNAGGAGVDNYSKESTVNMYGGSIESNVASRNGNGGGVYNAGTFNMYGGRIHGNVSTGVNSGGGVVNRGTFNMSGGSITNNRNPMDTGGGVRNAGTFTISGGEIANNYTWYFGGGVYNNYGATLTMTGGSIRSNGASRDSGGVYNYGTIIISGGSITQNHSNGGEGGNAGGVYNSHGSTLTMTGGSITKNYALKGKGGGVYNEGTFNLSGKPNISGNKKGGTRESDGTFTGGTFTGGTDNNVYILDNSENSHAIKTTGLRSGAKVGISAEGGATVVTGTSSATGFFSDDTSYKLASDRNNGLVLLAGHNDTHCVCGKSGCTDAEHGDAITWQPWNGKTSITYNDKVAYVYLTESVKRSEPISVDSDYTLYLCLNGNDITYDAVNYISTAKTPSGANLIITDCRATVGRITHGYNTSEKTGTVGSGIRVWGSLTLWNGCITGNNAGTGDSGGGVYVEDGGSFIMNGGSITDNAAGSNGGGVYVTKGGSFIMNGGSITDNTADTNGGGVHNRGTFEMSGTATVSGNTGSEGGGVYNYGIFNMSGAAVIADNLANDNTGGGGYGGGGVCNSGKSSAFNMSGGEIKNNTCINLSYGGGVCNRSSTFIMTGGSITGNSTSNGCSGGGVENYYSTFTMSGTAAINNNTAGSGAGVFNFQGTFNMNGGEIKNNISKGSYGGGVSNKRTFDKTDTVFNMTGGTISGNSASFAGGGVYNGGSATFNMSGGEIIDNNCSSNDGYGGGGVYNASGCKFTVSGKVKISGNVMGGTITNGTLEGGTRNNVRLNSSQSPITIEIGKSLSADSSIGISGYFNLTVVTGTTDTTGFFCDNTEYYLKDNGDGGLKLSQDAVLSGKLLVKNGGEEMTGGKKTYDAGAVVFTDAAVKIGSNTVEGVEYTYDWQKKGEDGAYTSLADLTGSTGPSDAGEYKLTVTATKDGDEAAVSSLTFTIEKVTLTVKVTAQDKEYDGTADATVKAELDKSGVIDGDDVSLVTDGVTAAFDTKDFGVDKTVTLSGSYKLSGAAAGNYTFVLSEDLTADINKKELTVDLTIANKVYDGTKNATFGSRPTLCGVIQSEDVTLTEGTPSFTRETAGEGILISFTEFSLSGADIGNYTLIQPAGITANITAYTSDKSEYRVNSNDNGWLNTDFIVTANDGWQLSYTDTADGEWVDKLTVSQETDNGTLRFYVRNKESGIISEVIEEGYKIDKTLPVGEIRINELNAWQQFIRAISFNLFFNYDQRVTIDANDGDNGSGIKTIEYLMTDEILEIDQLSDKTFTEYKNPVGIDRDTKLVIYAKITDTAGNVTYLRSDGIVIDKTAPVIRGAVNEKTYCSAVTLTVTDDNLKTVTLNREPVTLTDGKLTLSAAGRYEVVATDEAGNETTVVVIVNNGHTWGAWTSNGNNTHTRTCTVDETHTETADCSGGTATCQAKAICDDCHRSYGDFGEHDWDMTVWGYNTDPDRHAHTCKTENCTAHDAGAEHTPGAEATETTDQTCTECGYVIVHAFGHICANHLTPVEAKGATCTEDGNDAYYRCTCNKLYADATASVEITDPDSVVRRAPGHDWAPATCITPKTCKREGCGVTEGNPLGHNYSDDWSRDEANHWHACLNEGCTDKADFAEHTPGAEATETTDQTCTECGYVIASALGHICANHLTPVEAKNATCTEGGNKAYYRCSCNKLYADATASVEMTEDETVIPTADHDYEWKIDREATAAEKGSKHEECKICHDKKAAVEIPATGTVIPQTGSSIMIGLLISLLFVSGAGVTGMAVYSKRKRSAE